MARIYKINSTLLIEGQKPMPLNGLYPNYDNAPIVNIINRTDNKSVFSAPWQKIENQYGNSFPTELELTNYLDELFTTNGVSIRFIDLPILN